jgi:hypothetical protein
MYFCRVLWFQAFRVLNAVIYILHVAEYVAILMTAGCCCLPKQCASKAAFDNCIRARSERSDLIIERFYVLKT